MPETAFQSMTGKPSVGANRRPRLLGGATDVFATLALAAFSAVAAPAVDGGFSGSWALVATSDNIADKVSRGVWGALSGREAVGGGGGARGGGGFDLPLEVMTDARRIVVTDDGKTLNVTYPSGRRRTFVTDEMKRNVDDGDGPAEVVARRAGDTVTVISEWPRGYKLRETWEIRANPRSLVVTGRLRGRESQNYLRTYEPGPAVEAGSNPAIPATAVPKEGSAATAADPAAAGVPAGEQAPAIVDRLGECSIRAPRNASQGELGRLARITQQEAGKTAVASVAPKRPSDVISSDVEVLEGCLVWPFTLRVAGGRGVQEVFVDAGDGKIVRSEFVPMGPPPGEPPAP